MIRPALALASTLLRRPVTLAVAGALLLLGALGAGLPLLDVPGYELGEVGAWLGLVLGPPLAWWAAAAERRRDQGSPAVAALAVALASTALLALLFLAVAARAALGPCRALDGAAFFPVLALPSAWLAATSAVALAWPGRRWLLVMGAALTLSGSMGATLLQAWRGPAAFALDHFLGVWPGPLYDEALRLDARLLIFRAETVALALLVGGIGALAHRNRARPPWRAALVLVLASVMLGGLRYQLHRQVLDGNRAAKIGRAHV